MPVSTLSDTQHASTAATAASAAEPPAARMRRPTSAVAGCPAAIPAGTRITSLRRAELLRLDRPTFDSRFLILVVPARSPGEDSSCGLSIALSDGSVASGDHSAAVVEWVLTRRSVEPSPKA